jgi:hypothetical protein
MPLELFSPDQTLLARLFPIYDPSYVVHTMDDADFDGVRNLSFTLDHSPEIQRVWVEGGAKLVWPGMEPDELPIQGWVAAPTDEPWPIKTPAPYGDTEATLSDDSIVLDGMIQWAGLRFLKRAYGGKLQGKMTVGCEHWHPDGWRVGQYIMLSDSRLPPFLLGRNVCIQKVVTKLLPTIDWRVYDIEWGDAPQGRLTSLKVNRGEEKKEEGSKAYKPATLYWAGDGPHTAYSSQSPLVIGQLISADHQARRIPGVTCYLAIWAWNPEGVFTTPPNDVSVDPAVVITDINGTWETYLHVGDNIGWSFEVVAAGQVPPSGAW